MHKDSAMSSTNEPYLTTRAFVDRFRQETGADLKLSRFYKDRMKGLAPKPVARMGNRDLFSPRQIPEYAKVVIQPVEQQEDRAA
jgi:hypothetical protein